MIYLVAPYRYKEELILDGYAVGNEGIKNIITQYRKELFCESVKNFYVNYKARTVHFEAKADWDYEWEECTYYLFPIQQVKI